jgi:hypothetical protein
MLTGAAVLVAVTAIGGVVAMSDAEQATPTAQHPPVNTATVGRGRLSDMVSQYGTLTYRAGSDGSPYTVINRARGTFAKLEGEPGSNLDPDSRGSWQRTTPASRCCPRWRPWTSRKYAKRCSRSRGT